MAEMDYGEIEKKANIDTPEEFLTATYFSPIKIDRTKETQINMILPRNKEGALKLCAMWLKKRAENLSKVYSGKTDEKDYSTNYLQVVSKIMDKANISKSEVADYFAKAIESEIIKYGKEHLGKWYSESELRLSILKPLIEYYKDPSKSNLDKAVAMGRKITNYDALRGLGYKKVIYAMDVRTGSAFDGMILSMAQ